MAGQNLKAHKLGWIGIGRMGYAMAERLAKAESVRIRPLVMRCETAAGTIVEERAFNPVVTNLIALCASLYVITSSAVMNVTMLHTEY